MPKNDQNFGLLTLSDDELRKRYEGVCQRVVFSGNDYYAEIQRRTQTRHTSAIRRLATITAILAVITAAMGIFRLVLLFMSEP